MNDCSYKAKQTGSEWNMGGETVMKTDNGRLFSAIDNDNELVPYLLNTPFEGMLAVDTQGIVCFVNDFFAQLLHAESEELIGLHIDQVLPDCRLTDTLARGYSEWGDMLHIQGREVYTARFPLKEKGTLVGAMLKTVFPDLMVGRSIAERMMFLGSQTAPIPPTQKLFTCMSIVGETEEMLYVKKLARRASRTSSTLLITGESGTGKEVIAQAIHTRSVRRDAPFISVNCGAIPRELIESELFGYEGGAFTGAKRGGSPGKFELANGGTILLDEIGDMPKDMQVKLLRVLQEKEIWRVGGVKPIKLDVRVIASTNKDLLQMVREGTFRQDLYYRINILSIHMPPLRERLEDMPDLIKNLLERINHRIGSKAMGITPESMEIALNYSWPGNVRELENVLEQAVNWSNDEIIDFRRIPNRYWEADVDSQEADTSDGSEAPQNELDRKEMELLKNILKKSGGNRSEAARTLGISRSAFYRRLKKYHLE